MLDIVLWIIFLFIFVESYFEIINQAIKQK